MRSKIVILLLISTFLVGCSNADKIKEEPVAEKESQQQEETIDIDEAKDVAETDEMTEPVIEESGEGEPAPAEENIAAKVYLVIDFGGKIKKEVEVNLTLGATAFNVLESGAEKLGLSLETEKYSMGVFVKAIDAAEGGMDGKYWTYYVNDKFANVASDQYVLKVGDTVEWKFGKSPF